MNAPVQRTHWKQLVNPKYLGVYSLPNGGEDMIVTIKSVGREIVISDGGKKEECTVAQIVGNKPLILNRTNCKTIERIYKSAFIEDWSGKTITLFKSTTKVAGETVDCLRIRPSVPNVVQAKHPLSSEGFGKALQAVQSGQYTVQQILAKYELSTEQLARLNGAGPK
ncbi:hypothetical protein [Acinetobacter radioresistens]|jgi:hypothetical protein|uniref:hypothetical protein n=2 Tax=Acinetobacter radioresistens TaxID=40216 RepID=UPI000DAEA2AF|nr:hypothetical protein [Acinetobacter radioresistens]AWV87090.1 hypothetical protein DOM24_11000 [Acinetobacter radioresistens]MCX0328966.1 hypothetical protein [Acinetobacter radioresistens]